MNSAGNTNNCIAIDYVCVVYMCYLLSIIINCYVLSYLVLDKIKNGIYYIKATTMSYTASIKVSSVCV